MSLPKIVLVPIDFSDRAIAALDYAVELAARLDAKICLAHVVAAQLVTTEYGVPVTTMMLEEMAERQQGRLDQLVDARAGKAQFLPAVLVTGDPRVEIEHIARQIHADLIVMGTHGRRGVSRLVMGSVAEAVMRVAPCPVLLVREGIA